MITVYQYAKCSTCRNALKWLDEHGVEYTKKDIVAEPPSRAELERIFKKSSLPINKLFNTSGESYRAGGFKEKLAKMTEAQALDALARDGKLIKRPLIDLGHTALVGFDTDRYASALSR